MPLVRQLAVPTLPDGRGKSARRGQFPHLDSLVKTARHEILAVGRKGDRVHAVLVPIGSFQTLHQESGRGIPDANALVKRTGRHVLGIGRDGDRGYTVLDGQGENHLSGLNVPETNGAISTSGSDGSTIASEIQRVNVLLVSGEGVPDGALLDIPDLDGSVHALDKTGKKPTRINLSSAPVARNRPSGLKQTLRM